MSKSNDDLEYLRAQSLIECLLKKALAEEKDDEHELPQPDVEYNDGLGHNPLVSYVAIAYNDGRIVKYDGMYIPNSTIGDRNYIENWANNVANEEGGWKALYVKGGTYFIEYGDTDGVFWTKNPAGQVIDGRWTDKFQPLHPKKSLDAYNDTVNRYIEKGKSKGLVPHSSSNGCNQR